MEKLFDVWMVRYSGPDDSEFNDMIDLGDYVLNEIRIAVVKPDAEIVVLAFNGNDSDTEANANLIEALADDSDCVPGLVLKAEIDRLRQQAFAIATALNANKITM